MRGPEDGGVVRLARRRYTSYWNAVLLHMVFSLEITDKLCKIYRIYLQFSLLVFSITLLNFM